MNALIGAFGFVSFFIFIGFMALTIYLYILIFKLAVRGIRALDIYIAEKERH